MTFLHSLRISARKFGLEVRRADYHAIESLRLAKQLRENDCDVVLDVGANVGQFASELFDDGRYEGEIVSFEPIADAYGHLAAKAEKYRTKGKNWRVGPRLAIGADVSSATFHISGNSVSSSLALMMESHVQATPESKLTAHVEVDVRPLSLLVDELKIDSRKIFLKMDTQGTEHDVLTGALPIMDRIAGIKVELSIIDLYHGQRLYPELDRLVRESGFQMWDLIGGFRHPSSSQLLQFDAIYFRR
jgi:FkbM family methyltransferase